MHKVEESLQLKGLKEVLLELLTKYTNMQTVKLNYAASGATSSYKSSSSLSMLS